MSTTNVLMIVAGSGGDITASVIKLDSQPDCATIKPSCFSICYNTVLAFDPEPAR
jgi:hypothetical protein